MYDEESFPMTMDENEGGDGMGSLEKDSEEINSHWSYEDPIYRFYCEWRVR